VYASGINPDGCDRMAAASKARGYRSFKLKIGFGEQRDLANLAAMRDAIGPEGGLMVDVNQGWSLDEALQRVPGLAPFALGWLEEPLRADRPWSEWQALAQATAIPLAAGENVAGAAPFDAAIASGTLRILQPDSAKWGGISGNWPVIAAAQAAGLRYCPHYLGGGIGLLHSAHLLAASGEASRGMLEIDANANPLRTAVAGTLNDVAEGACALGELPGIGLAPDLAELARIAAAGC
jgi:D-galactarolactone cycloisomerase